MSEWKDSDDDRRERREHQYRLYDFIIRASWLFLGTMSMAMVVAVTSHWLRSSAGNDPRGPDDNARLARLEGRVDALAIERSSSAPPSVPEVSEGRTLSAASAMLAGLAAKDPKGRISRAGLLDLLVPLEQAGLATKDQGNKLLTTLIGDANDVAVDFAKKALGKTIEGSEHKVASDSQTMSQSQVCTLEAPPQNVPPNATKPPISDVHPPQPKTKTKHTHRVCHVVSW